MEMNMKTLLPLLSVLFCLLFVSPALGSDWVEIGRNGDSVFLYDKESVKHISDNIVQVLDRCDYNDEGRKKFFQQRIETGLSTKGYENFSYQVYTIQINCQDKKMKTLKKTHYDADGKVLFNFSYDQPQWKSVIPGSGGDTIYNQVCPK
jgi:hypothetical protein